MDIQMYGENSRFKLRTSALIIEDNQLLLTKNSHDPMYYTVGGKVELGETTEETVLREVYEETGIHYEIDRLLYVQELFYDANFSPHAEHFHEIIFHYLMKKKGVKEFNHDSFTQMGYQEKLYWISIENLAKYYTYPRCLGDLVKSYTNQTQHIISFEDYE